MRYKKIDELVDRIIGLVESGGNVYIYGEKVRRVSKSPTRYRYVLVVELESGRQFVMHPSRFLHYLWNKSELLSSLS